MEPLRPFDRRVGKCGPGAGELQSCIDRFQIGGEVFNEGLANPVFWTNRVTTLDLGLNWYLNKYVKIYFDWQRSQYSSPVQHKPGGFFSLERSLLAAMPILLLNARTVRVPDERNGSSRIGKFAVKSSKSALTAPRQACHDIRRATSACGCDVLMASAFYGVGVACALVFFSCHMASAIFIAVVLL